MRRFAEELYVSLFSDLFDGERKNPPVDDIYALILVCLNTPTREMAYKLVVNLSC